MADREKATATPSKLAHLTRRPLYAKSQPDASTLKAAADRAEQPQASAAKIRALRKAAQQAADRAEERAAEKAKRKSTFGGRSRFGSSAKTKDSPPSSKGRTR